MAEALRGPGAPSPRGRASGSSRRPVEVLGDTEGSATARLPARPARPAPRRRPRPALRRVRRTVKHVNPLSVLKVSLFFYGVFLVLWLLAVAIAYTVVDSMGLIDTVEVIGRRLVIRPLQDIDISLMDVERWALLLGVAVASIASLINTLLAFLYNLAADIVGGLEVVFVERDEQPGGP